jgi:hypothetical protein
MAAPTPDQVAAYLRTFEAQVKDKFAVAQAKFDEAQAINEALRQRVDQLEKRDLNVETLAGKRVPYHVQINITVPQATAAVVNGTVTLTRSGPFVARRLFASLRVQTVRAGGNADWVGRYLPLSSHETYTMENYWKPVASIEDVVDPPLDFEWGYSDGGSDRNRQDRYISGDILARHDEDGFMMADEVFASGATIAFIVSPLRPVGGNAPWNDANTGVATFEFQATFVGYRIVQPLVV